jgi:hypothetical protein
MLTPNSLPEIAAEIKISDERRLVNAVLAKERKATAQFVDLCSDWIYGF